MRCLVMLLLCVLLQAAWAADAPVDPRVDAVYLALGQGDMARAADLSAALLAQVSDSDRQRGAVLQARIDVLAQRTELDKPEGLALREAVQRFSKASPLRQSLSDRLELANSLAANDAQATLALVQTLLAAPRQKSLEDIAELRSAEARAAALANGKLEQARTAAGLALQAWRTQPGLRARGHEVALYYVIASVYEYTGSSSQALAQFEQGSRIAVASFGADSLARIRIDTSLAGVLVDLGRNSEALALREKVLTATRHRFGDSSIQAAKAEAMIGAGLQEIGDYPSARQRYEHAEAIVAVLPQASAQERGVIATNYGNLLQEMGEEDAALAHYRQALAAWGDGEQTTHARAVVFANIGNTEFRLKHYDEAIADFQRALALRESSDGKDSPGLSYALEGLGSSALALGHNADAEGYYRRAIEVRGRSLAPDHPTLAPLTFGLALAFWGQGRIDEAFKYARLTAEHQHSLLATFASDFAERQSVAYRDLLMPATALVVTLAGRRGDAASIDLAWHLVMVERGLVARSEAERLAAARSAHDPVLAAAWEAWRHANTALGEAWLSTSTTTERMAQLRAEAESAERGLWERAGHHPLDDAGKTVEIADFARALPADGMLIAFTEGVADNSARLLAAGEKEAPEDWYAFTLAAGGTPRLQRVGDAAALSAQSRAWYADLRDPGSDTAQLRRNGLALRSVLLDPFVSGDAKRSLFVVPEGELFRVSFAALPAGATGYLIESGTRVHTLAHESDLLLPAPSAAARTALLAGAPDFPQIASVSASAERQVCLRASRQGFAAIPNAARELGDLQTLLAANSTKQQVQLLSGATATKENVLAALAGANVIHLATHGFSLDESCAEDRTVRGVTLNGTAAVATASLSSNSALSGLAFTGASVAQARDPVGVLSAGEIAAQDLSHADWVALSACDSGLGPIGRNEGVFGMRRALRLAGARTVVMSLWQVDDAATADLMQSLYRARFVDHDDVPASMALAMQSVLNARRAAGQSDHPYYWAAFIGEGGWR